MAGRVGDRIRQEVAQGCQELTLVAVQEAAGRLTHLDLDLLPRGERAHFVHGSTDEVVDTDDLRSRERIISLQPGQVDDVLHERAEPSRLDLHALGEVADLLLIVGRSQERLGEKGDGTHRRLQLVTHVRDEVPPDDVDSALLGQIVDEHQDGPRAEGGDPHAELQEFPAERWPADPHLEFPSMAVAGSPVDEVADVGHGHLIACHESQTRGTGVGPEDGSVRGHHERGGRENAQHAHDLIGHHGHAGGG